MSDDPKKKKQDAKLVSRQPWEERYLARKHDLPRGLVDYAIREYGPSRKPVENRLKEWKDNGRRR